MVRLVARLCSRRFSVLRRFFLALFVCGIEADSESHRSGHGTKGDCSTFGGDGKKQTLKVEIQKRGDAYLLRWDVRGGVAFVGSGIRQGNTLSVAWVNRGSVGVSVYKIEKGPKLVGTYTEVGGPGLIGKEVLTADAKTDGMEARNRR